MSKSAEIILFKHHIYKDIINNALNIVKQYILNNQRIVVGGMAIDMALKLKNSKLYDDDEIPDYDFFSFEFHKDAYNLASLLIKNLGPSIDISVINALHFSTMRVRVNYVVVADITYVPKNIYKKIPTLVREGFIFVHPHFQFITQHLSLYSPYKNSPYETVLYRWEKDMKRYNLLLEKYPINFDINQKLNNDLACHQKKQASSPSCRGSPSLKKYNIEIELLKNSCLTGIVGCLFWYNKAIKMGFKNKINYGNFEIKNKNIIYESPTNILIIYASNYIKKCGEISKDKNIEKYNAILDIMPQRIETKINYNLIKILDSHNQLISSYIEKDIYFANLQNIMSILLIKYFFYENNKFYLLFYNLCISIIKWASEKYIKSNNNKLLPFFPSLESYGTKEIGIHMQLNKKKFKQLKNKDIKDKMKLPSKYFFNKLNNESINKKLYLYDPEKYYHINGLIQK